MDARNDNNKQDKVAPAIQRWLDAQKNREPLRAEKVYQAR